MFPNHQTPYARMTYAFLHLSGPVASTSSPSPSSTSSQPLLILHPSLPRRWPIPPPAVHAPVAYPVAGVHLLLPSWLLRLDVVIVRPVDYCPRNPQSALTSQYDPRIWGKQAREGNSVPQILHEIANGTSDFLVLVCREWYHWLSVPESESASVSLILIVPASSLS